MGLAAAGDGTDSCPVLRRDGWSQVIRRYNGRERWTMAVCGESAADVLAQVALLTKADEILQEREERIRAEEWEADRPVREARAALQRAESEKFRALEAAAAKHNAAVQTRQLGRLEARRERKAAQRTAKHERKRGKR